MTPGQLQQQLFEAIRSRLQPGQSLADELAGKLGISTDSAYRRLRGEKTIGLDELYTLCLDYKLSLDQLLGLTPDGIVFQGRYLDKKTFRFEAYIENVKKNLAYMNSFREKTFYYLCKDLPIFYHYHLQEIAAFKWFFWLKTYFHFPEFQRKKFRFEDHPEDILRTGQEIIDLYNQIPCVELWNLESMNILLRQVDFYRDAQVFVSDHDIYRLYEAISHLWDHLEKQAALGYKFPIGDPGRKQAPVHMYFNEVLLGDNNMLVELDGQKITYVSHSTINFMTTRDITFNENMYQHIHNQMRRSTLISEVSEKERARFFRLIREKIEHRKASLRV